MAWNAAVREAQARVRADGGDLYVVTFDAQTTALGRDVTDWRSEGLCAQDAEALRRELDFNGYAGVTVEKIR